MRSFEATSMVAHECGDDGDNDMTLKVCMVELSNQVVIFAVTPSIKVCMVETPSSRVCGDTMYSTSSDKI